MSGKPHRREAHEAPNRRVDRGEQEHRHQGHEGHQDHGGHGEEDSRQDHAGYGEDHAEDHREDDVADLSCEEDHYREEEVMPNAAPSGVRSFGGAFTI